MRLPDGSAAEYPVTRAGDQVDDYHGVRVADPYRWLEDLDSAETAEWVQAQNELTSRYLDQLPERDAIRARLTELWDFERFGVPFRRGERVFYMRNDGLQNQAVLWTAPTLHAEPTVLLDPNRWSEDGTVALTGLRVSDDGRLVAFGVSASGSDWQEWKVLDVQSREETGDRLRWVKFSGASWTPDGKGFFYSRYDEPTGFEQLNYYQKLYYHRLGTAQSDDELVFERPDCKEWGIHGEVTEDGRYLVLTITVGTDSRTCLFYEDLADPSGEVVELLPGFEAEFAYLANDGPVLYVATDLHAPRRRVVAIDVTNPGRASWRDVVAEAEDALESASVVRDRVFCVYLHHAASRVLVYRLDGTFEREVPLPGLGTVTGFPGRRTDRDTFYSFDSYVAPPRIYRLELDSGSGELFREPKVAFDASAYETSRVFYTSPDGTRIPMFVSHRTGLRRDGANPTVLYGYGGFRIPSTPMFRVGALGFMERGGIWAVPCIRGGGEYGEEWHLAGTKGRKQNVFDDFCAAAQWLVDDGYTSTSCLAIQGGSNGGLLVGACLNQRPDLFGAANAAVGVMDMLRFTRFTIGWAWTSDYGDPDDPDDFRVLSAYSPLHNLRPGTAYPPTLITTADHDDRVWPGHSFKYAAALQAAQSGDAPVLLRVEVRAGHGLGKPTAKLIDEATDVWSFLEHRLRRG